MNTKEMENGKWKMENGRGMFFVALVLIFSIFHFPFSIKAQVRAVNDYGAIGLAQLLKKLNTTKSVLMIGAHPDDEDSALLAYLARGENARTAYLSLTRGDGGQNIIGSELFESLGVIRTEELLQARRLDGAGQFFTRAFDFGFTKTLAETKQKWDEKVILCDAVNVIRYFRPLVVISRFAGTPADGHGQHQYSGYISPLAVRAAADESQCKNSGAAWQVQKFYVEQGFRDSSQPTLKINTGEYNPLLGRSYAEIAAEGRSQHKTQEQGGLELKGDRFSGLNLIESIVPKVGKETNIFDGIDFSLDAVPKTFVRDEKIVSEYTKGQLLKAKQSAERALKEYDPKNPQQIVPILIEGRKAVNDLFFSYIAFSEPPERRENFKERLKNEREISAITSVKLDEFTEAVRLALGIRIDALSNQETVTDGDNFLTSVKVFYPENTNIKFKDIDLKTANGWQISMFEEPKNDSPSARFFRETANQSKLFNVKISPDTKITQPYFLENPRTDNFYTGNNSGNFIFPFQYPFFNGYATFDVYGETITFSQRVQYRFADNIRGEVRRELNVVPKVSFSLDQNLLIIPQSGKPQKRQLILNVTNNSNQSFEAEANLSLGLFSNWQSAPLSQNFSLKNKGQKISIPFEISIPANPKTGIFDLLPSAVYPDGVFSDEMHTLAYEHIQTHRFYTQLRAKAIVLDLKTAPVKVGYIMGSGDEVPEAIRQMNLPVDLLGEKDLSGGDLAKYDVIVAGIRAYQVREDLLADNQKVLDYVKNGGTLIVQYQRPDYAANKLPPFPADMNDTQKTTAGTTARVVDENAKVTILDANSPIFNYPNKITDADFANWVQERNLYDFVTFDKNYTPLLETHDVGEQENKGGMVYAKVGKGNYVYTSYSFFRQLPAGVPGAYRLFANLLSLPKAKK